jgi:hypothetical protein
MPENNKTQACKDPVIIITLILIAGGLLLIAAWFGMSMITSGSAGHATIVPGAKTSVLIEASPQKYSPFMSSTVGIGLTPNVTGFALPDATYEWHATYGRFLDWATGTHTLREFGTTAVSHGEKIYWTFYEFPDSPVPPVEVSVIAKDTKTGQVLGTSRMTLGWEQNNTIVSVQDIS